MWLWIKVVGAVGFPVGLLWCVNASVGSKNPAVPVVITAIALFMFVAARFQESAKSQRERLPVPTTSSLGNGWSSSKIIAAIPSALLPTKERNAVSMLPCRSRSMS